MTTWKMCGLRDPAEDGIAVWLVYEAMGPRGASRGLRMALCLWKHGRYTPIKVAANQPLTRIRGKLICWAYVTETPELPMLADDGGGFRLIE